MQKGDPPNPISADQKPASSLSLEPAAQTVPKVPGKTADPLAPEAISPTAAEYAGFWLRLASTFIDVFVLGFVGVTVQFIFGFSRLFEAGLLVQQTEPRQPLLAAGVLLIGLVGTSILVFMAIEIVYFAGLTAAYGATVGKMVLGLRVVTTNGQKIGFGKAALREIIGKWISGLVFGLGYLWVAFDEKKQGWHDKIAGTYVVKIR